MKLVDSHCHLYDIRRYTIPEDIIPVVVGYSHSSNRKAVEVAKEKGYPFVLGIAPQTAIRSDTSHLDEWIGFIRDSRPNAIGEVGLDYKWAKTMEDVKKERVVFERMIGLARDMKLPLVIHSRNNSLDNEVPKDAVEDIIRVVGDMPLVMHFYTGSEEQAKRISSKGGYISVTHLHSKERRKVINSVSLDKLLVESDSPYVGRTPETVRDAVRYIADVKGLSFDEVAAKTSENAARIFGFRL